MEPSFEQQFLWHNDHVVPRQRWADNGMRTGDVICEAIARGQIETAAVLLETRNAVCLKQNFDKGVLASFAARNRMGKPMLADFDMTKLQSTHGRVVDLCVKGRSVERIDVKLAAKFGQRLGPRLDLPPGCQSGSTKGMDRTCHNPTTRVNREQT